MFGARVRDIESQQGAKACPLKLGVRGREGEREGERARERERQREREREREGGERKRDIEREKDERIRREIKKWMNRVI